MKDKQELKDEQKFYLTNAGHTQGRHYRLF